MHVKRPISSLCEVGFKRPTKVGFGKAPLPSNVYKSYNRLTKKMYL